MTGGEEPQPAQPATGVEAAAPEPTGRFRRKLPWLSLAAVCLAADLWTKYLVFYPLRPEGELVGRVTSWWQIRIAFNRGITFGLASDAGLWVIAVATSLVIATLIWTLWTSGHDERLKSASLAMIIGGAIGNLYDRTLRPMVELDSRPGVRDFLDWYAPDDWALAGWLRERGMTTHWYTSNVADVLIVCGVILLAWLIITEKKPAEAQPAGTPR